MGEYIFPAHFSRKMASMIFYLLLLVLCQLWPTTGSANAKPTRRFEAPEKTQYLPVVEEEEEECVSCEMLFSKLTTIPSGQRVQYLEMQLRGEPKSGTGFMYEWASGALYHTCDFLNHSFGEDTCHMTTTSEGSDTQVSQTGQHTNRTLTFEPYRRDAGARCKCNGVDKVVISVSRFSKHTLPVHNSCPWYHRNTIARNEPACPSVGGKPVANHDDLWNCMEEANCTIKDNRHQFATLRDPRPMAVSAYYHRVRDEKLQEEDINSYVMALLPYICQWITIRYMLFAGLLSAQSTIFWYEDTLARPLEFHHRWLESVGLHTPSSIVEQATEAALREDFAFSYKGVDKHLSPNEVTNSSRPENIDLQQEGRETELDRSWRDNISADLHEDIDDVVRVWLPSVLLAKLGI